MPVYTHDRLVQLAINEAIRQGVTNIKADHLPENSKPAQIGKYIPDVTGTHSSGTIIVEAESADGLKLTHTTDQFATFYREANRIGGTFIVAVNLADKAAAEVAVKQACDNSTKVLIWTF